jgi:hypothetical protein
MNTSAEALQRLQTALSGARDAQKVIDNLVVEHDYQDVATLVTQAAAALLEAAAALMESQDETAFEALDRADDLLDAVYDIIDSEMDDE